MRRSGARGATGPGSTAAVLWLMILLVFLPIVAMHVAAVWVNGGEGGDPAPAAEPPATR